MSGSATEASFWQYPDEEQKGAQQGQSALELQLPGPLPTSTVSSPPHTFPFHETHATVGVRVVRPAIPINHQVQLCTSWSVPHKIYCHIWPMSRYYLKSSYSRQFAIRCNSDLRICNRYHWRSGHFCMQLPKLLWPTYMNRKCSFGTLLFFQPHEMPIGNQDFRKDHIYSYLRLDPTTFR